jgi:hypothetical protein
MGNEGTKKSHPLLSLVVEGLNVSQGVPFVSLRQQAHQSIYARHRDTNRRIQVRMLFLLV